MVEIQGRNVPANVTEFFAELSPERVSGWFATSGDLLDVFDPATGEVIARVPISSPEDVDAAVAGSRRAFDSGPWPRMTPADRSAVMQRLANGVRDNADLLADIATLETGNPRTQSQVMHGTSPADFFDWWADVAESGPPEGWKQELPADDGPLASESTLYREPVGVVAALAAYNMPLLIAAFKLGGAMAAGCTTVFLPSPRTPLHGVALAKIAADAGLPEGVLNLVLGEAAVGQRLTESEDVDLVTFTGSAAVGKAILRQVAGSVKRTVLELGGKSPDIILPGVDLQQVVKPSLARLTRNAGQMCGATTRTYVHADQYDEYLKMLQAELDSLVVGDPWDEATDMGPVIREVHRASVNGFVERALSDGATVLAEGSAGTESEGYYVKPTVLGNADPDSEIAQEEVFGPVSVVFPYETVEEAVELANNSRYGLNANVWGDADAAVEVGRRLRAGTVTINGGGAVRPEAPWPSMGESGIGVDRGYDGYREFFKIRHIQVRRTA